MRVCDGSDGCDGCVTEVVMMLMMLMVCVLGADVFLCLENLRDASWNLPEQRLLA